MDANGYIDSIIPGHDEYSCWLCKQNGRGKMDRHEVFHGISNRHKSKHYGLWVNLCHEPCHETIIHGGGEDNERLQVVAQEYAMEHYGWTKDDFRMVFGKSFV